MDITIKDLYAIIGQLTTENAVLKQLLENAKRQYMTFADKVNGTKEGLPVYKADKETTDKLTEVFGVKVEPPDP